MIRFVLIAVLILIATMCSDAQSIKNPTIEHVLISMSDTLAGDHGQWRFRVGDMWIMCLVDEDQHRIKIMTPIIDVDEMHAGEMQKCMEANFEAALDVKYCISDNIVWSVFSHPLRGLTDIQIADAVRQVYNASATFGSTYTSRETIIRNKKQPAIQDGKSKS